MPFAGSAGHCHKQQPSCPHQQWCLPDVVLQLGSNGARQLLQALTEGAHCLSFGLGGQLGVPGRRGVFLLALQCAPSRLVHKALCAGLTGHCCSVRLWADTKGTTKLQCHALALLTIWVLMTQTRLTYAAIFGACSSI